MISSLSYSLRLLTQYASGKILMESLHAIAILMETETTITNGNNITSYVIEKLSPLLEHTETAATEICKATEETKKAANQLYNTCKESRDEIQRSVEGINAALEGTDPHPAPTTSTTLSYAAALNS
jgi:hypothetical protein